MGDLNFNVSLPHIAPKWNLEQFAATVKDDEWKYFVISDHSADEDVRAMGLEEKGARVHYVRNGSIAAAWNRGMRERLDFTIICSVSMRFTDGLIPVARQLIDGSVRCALGGISQHGWHLALVKRVLTDKVGLFDENIRPAYLEDTDMMHRIALTRLEALSAQNKPETTKADVYTGWMEENLGRGIQVSATRKGDGIARGSWKCLSCRDNENAAYYALKWGALPTREYYKHPFNDPNNKLSYWPEVPS